MPLPAKRPKALKLNSPSSDLNRWTNLNRSDVVPLENVATFLEDYFPSLVSQSFF